MHPHWLPLHTAGSSDLSGQRTYDAADSAEAAEPPQTRARRTVAQTLGHAGAHEAARGDADQGSDKRAIPALDTPLDLQDAYRHGVTVETRLTGRVAHPSRNRIRTGNDKPDVPVAAGGSLPERARHRVLLVSRVLLLS
jgi:hypothetical protein